MYFNKTHIKDLKNRNYNKIIQINKIIKLTVICIYYAINACTIFIISVCQYSSTDIFVQGVIHLQQC